MMWPILKAPTLAYNASRGLLDSRASGVSRHNETDFGKTLARLHAPPIRSSRQCPVALVGENQRPGTAIVIALPCSYNNNN